MNAALWKAHLDAVDLRHQIRGLEGELRAATAYGRCVYCGARTRDPGRVCRAHTDLPGIDPGYRGT